jgi:nicotinamidase-related amidase
MTDRIWDEYLSDRDRRVVEAAGYETRGASSWESRTKGDTPAVLVIDMQRITVGDDVDIFEAIEESPISMGEVAWDAMEHIVPFVEFARELDVPVIHTRIVPSGYEPDDPEVRIVDELTPEGDEPVIRKSYASGFYGTDLLSQLVRRDVDTLFVVGNTTSGCLRATVVDAQQHGFNAVVPENCVFDRLNLSHATALLDMWMKYAQVLDDEDARAMLEELATA